MSRADLLAWLRARRPAPPEQLGASIERALRAAPAALVARPIPEALLGVGRALLQDLAGRPDAGRALALDLLAADAFITYAFEAQSELGLENLNRLAEAARGGQS